ncbi:MAG: decarboxylating NADP(+)-dependent phosphogluconate dehydrogenase [Deltaproteobacteria bacterium]|nr:decarboxylating NADP(+)-dependent phosphogluconate dehydrogenase [Deltaproteobacteria bacterium]
MSKADIAVIGLAVMGRNLVLNLDDHGYTVAAYNRTVERTDEFLAGEAAGTKVIGTRTIEDMVAALERPRRVLIMVKAGRAVDAVIDQLTPLLDEGDIIIDGGNSHYPDSDRRTDALADKGILFVGMGISGGEEGARHGPSMMPGGNIDAWPAIKDMFQAISAVADGEPCCQWVGEQGAGHYVKMVHNGIEYGDMQVICEAYQLLREGLGYDTKKCAEVFRGWNDGLLESYLIEITSEILAVDDRDGQPLVDKILDSAGQKGTGKWTAVNALELGAPLTLISEAVNSRFLSARKSERGRASALLGEPSGGPHSSSGWIERVRDAVYASKIISYAQGFMLMRDAAREFGWTIEFDEVAALWRAGCIIRSRFLGDIRSAFSSDADLDSLLLSSFFIDAVKNAESGWRASIAMGVEHGIPLPAMSSALAFYDGYRRKTLPANLLQAQRDYFGAHTYRRVDRDPDSSYHFDWTGDKVEREVD